MVHAKKLPSGNFRAVAEYRGDDNKRRYKSFTCPTEAEANWQAEQFEKKAKNRKLPENMTVGDAIDRYIETRSAVLSPTTIQGYKCCRRNTLQKLMNISLYNLTNDLIQQAVNEDSFCGKSPKTTMNSFGLLNSALNIYYPEFKTSISLPKRIKKLISVPQAKDIPQILDAVSGTEVYLPVLLSITFGMRLSEVRGLKWEDVNGDYILIHTTIVDIDGKPVVRESTKSNAATRVVLMPEVLKQAIINADKSKSEYMTSLNGRVIYKRFRAALRKHGIPLFRFHDLRHLNASVMLMLGVPDKYAMERGGWATTSIFKTVYSHTFTDESKIVNEKINSYFDDIAAPHTTQAIPTATTKANGSSVSDLPSTGIKDKLG